MPHLFRLRDWTPDQKSVAVGDRVYDIDEGQVVVDDTHAQNLLVHGAEHVTALEPGEEVPAPKKPRGGKAKGKDAPDA